MQRGRVSGLFCFWRGMKPKQGPPPQPSPSLWEREEAVLAANCPLPLPKARGGLGRGAVAVAFCLASVFQPESSAAGHFDNAELKAGAKAKAKAPLPNPPLRCAKGRETSLRQVRKTLTAPWRSPRTPGVHLHCRSAGSCSRPGRRGRSGRGRRCRNHRQHRR